MDQPDDLRLRRCLHHATREAVARCPRCGRSFCRECISEHDGLWLCAACLAAEGEGSAARRGRLVLVWSGLRVGAGLFVAWFYFYLVGQALLAFHDPIHPGGDRPGVTAP
ncbi:MAG TPA: rhomboid family protein [Candidatus Polarisedimenticolia bacterium]|nr:rhomboid family protein [Candidatus Polarisedimenticolia bacterium]